MSAACPRACACGWSNRCATCSRTRCARWAASSESRRRSWAGHPFPGPGLAIRIPGEVTREKADLLRKVDSIYLEEIRNAGLYDAIWQAFAVLLPVRTVGVMGMGAPTTWPARCAR